MVHQNSSTTSVHDRCGTFELYVKKKNQPLNINIAWSTDMLNTFQMCIFREIVILLNYASLMIMPLIRDSCHTQHDMIRTSSQGHVIIKFGFHIYKLFYLLRDVISNYTLDK